MDTQSPPATTEPPVIEMTGVGVGAIQDVSRVVLEEVNWTVNAGEQWVIAGMHGSGKTNLMWLTAGIMPPQGGAYRLFGQGMPMYGDEQVGERLRLGLVFETGQLFHQLNVRDNIALPLRYHRHLPAQEMEERVNAMLEMTELTQFAEVMPGALGRNWQKRVGLARALMLEPEVLLIDRPLGGLDLRHANWWLNFFRQWHAKQDLARPRTLVVTVEDLRPWRNLDAHFAILQKQRFITLGRRPAFASHQEPLVKELLAEELPRG